MRGTAAVRLVACGGRSSRRFIEAGSRCLAQRHVAWSQVRPLQSSPSPERQEAQEACERVTKVGAACNVALCAVKGAAGYVGGSSAMVADAVHSLGDLVSDAVTLTAIRYARLPPDDQFPFGRGKYEALGALGVAGLLVSTAWGIGWYAFESAVNAQTIDTALLHYALAGGAASIVVKEWLYHVTVKAGTRAQSEVTVANAWHHRSDALSSVVAVAGVGGSMLGWTWLDPVAGAVVAAMIARTGFEIGRSSIGELTDHSTEVSPELVASIDAAVGRRKGIRCVQKVRVRKTGPFVILYMTVVVDPVTSVSGAAQLAAGIRRDILASREEVQHVFINVSAQSDEAVAGDPVVDPDQIRAAATAVLRTFPEIREVTHFTAHYLSGRVSVHMEVIMGPGIKRLDEAARIARRAEAAVVHGVDAVAHADIHLELRPLRKFCDAFDEASLPQSTAAGQCPGGGGLCPPPRAPAAKGIRGAKKAVEAEH